jgi:hypothetical protein
MSGASGVGGTDGMGGAGRVGASCDDLLKGTCDGTKLTLCLGLDSGKIQTTDCATNSDGKTACNVGADGVAACDLPGATGCGAVPEVGICNGNSLSTCVASNIQTTDCAAMGMDCALKDNRTFACIAKTNPGAGNTVSGTVAFEKQVVDTSTLMTAKNGFLPEPKLVPVRQASVLLIRKSDDEPVDRSYTDDSGAFTLNAPSPDLEAYVLVMAAGDPTKYPFTIRNCPLGPMGELPPDCPDGFGTVHYFKGADFTGPQTLGQQVITIASGEAGAFNIYNLMIAGGTFARDNLNAGMNPSTPAYTVEWLQKWQTMTSFFSSDTNAITVQGGEADTDEFDDPVLMHEYGHFLEANFSKSDSPGGDHDGSPTDPRLAFGEGYGTYVGCRVAGSSLYFDTAASGTSVTDLNNTGIAALADSPDGIKQLLSEYMVGEVLWQLDWGSGGDTAGAGATGGQGSAPIFDVLEHYFKDNANFKDRGVEGRDLVDFVDGWFCRDFEMKAAASTPVFQGLLVGHGWPYDDFDHVQAPVGSCK